MHAYTMRNRKYQMSSFTRKIADIESLTPKASILTEYINVHLDAKTAVEEPCPTARQAEAPCTCPSLKAQTFSKKQDAPLCMSICL